MGFLYFIVCFYYTTSFLFLQKKKTNSLQQPQTCPLRSKRLRNKRPRLPWPVLAPTPRRRSGPRVRLVKSSPMPSSSTSPPLPSSKLKSPSTRSSLPPSSPTVSRSPSPLLAVVLSTSARRSSSRWFPLPPSSTSTPATSPPTNNKRNILFTTFYYFTIYTLSFCVYNIFYIYISILFVKTILSHEKGFSW